MQQRPTFWTWQHRALGWLLAWGVGNIAVGAGLATDKRLVVRHFGLQALSWGAINAALALNGRRGARAKQTDPTVADQQGREAARFQTIVAVNTALDVLYIAGGARLIGSAERESRQRGMGIGIAIQGAFLLIYDAWLTWRSAAWQA